MNPSSLSELTEAYQGFVRAAVNFIQTPLPPEEMGLTAVSIRLLEADLVDLRTKARIFDKVYSRYPCPDQVPQGVIAGIQRQLDWCQHLIAGLKAIKPYVEFQSTAARRDPKAGETEKKGGRHEK